MRIAFYSHDSYGLGHLQRCLKLAEALARRASVQGLLLTGSPWASAFARPAGFRVVALAPLRKLAPGRYEAREPGLDLERVIAARRTCLARAVERFRPDLVVVDQAPAGLGGELAPLLGTAGTPGAPRLALALRDIVDEPGRVRTQWRESGAYEALRRYDEIWVFGSRDELDPREAYAFPAETHDRVHFCGRLGTRTAPGRPGARAGARPRVLLTGGGGGDAAQLVDTFAEVMRAKPGFDATIVLGPDYAGSTRALLDVPARVLRFVPDLPRVMTQADAVVAMAGYNTTCEILATGRPAVLVPRIWPREEQWLRATGLARRGRALVVHPRALAVATLRRAIETALAHPGYAPEPGDGAAHAAKRALRLARGEARDGR